MELKRIRQSKYMLGASLRIAFFLPLLLVVPLAAVAAPAVRLAVAIPCDTVCPGTTYYIRVMSGEPFSLVVYALDSANDVDTGFVGTVTFSSTDPSSVLPSSYAFTVADQGGHFFSRAGVLYQLGSQTISASASGVATGTWNVAVDPEGGPVPIPIMGGKITALFILILAASGVWQLNASR